MKLGENCPDSALANYHKEVLTVLEKLVPAKKKKANSKPKHRMRRILWKKHSLQ